MPPEILALISSHLMFTSVGTEAINDTQPTVFEVPPAFTLDRFMHSVHPHAHFPPSLQASIPAPPIPMETPLSPHHLRTRSHVTEALQAAINSGIKTSSLETEEPRATFHSNGSSVSLSISMKTVTQTQMMSEPTSETVEPLDIPSEATSETGPPTNAELDAEAQLPSLGATPSPPSTSAPSFLLGNLFLSSCPGKKGTVSSPRFKTAGLFPIVRLQGPVKGRSGVCRDLSTDLQRMKDLGVGCVVW